MCKEYNGWTNYETWAVKLWLDNDGGLYAAQEEWAEDAWRYHGDRSVESYLADMVKDFVEEQNPLVDQASLFSDLLNAALSSVNWYEIAENILSEFPQETEDEEADAEEGEE